MSSITNLLRPIGFEDSNNLAKALESLPSYDNTMQYSDESVLFVNEQESASGLIDFIRRDPFSTTPASESIESTDTEDGMTTGEIHSPAQTSNNDSTGIEHEVDPEEYQKLLKSHVKHIFILSENGKPVFTRYGDEDQLVTLMGVMQTLVSFAELAESSRLNYLKAGRARIAFLHREPFIFVIVTHKHESSLCLFQQLTYIYHQIISTLTLSRVKHKFSLQPNFDLRRWLSNAEKKLLNNIIDMYEQDIGMLMLSARCLPLSPNIRSQIGQIVAQTIRGQPDIVFALVLSHDQLVSIARLKDYHFHPTDLHLLINLIKSADAFKGAESWVPVCLPRFDSGASFHAHISYVDENCDVCLVLLTVNPERFQQIFDLKQIIHNKIIGQNLIQPIRLALEKDVHPFSGAACNDVRYYAYKSRRLSQYVSSKLSNHYTTNDQHIKLFDLIRYVYGYLHNPNHQLKVICHKTEYESLLGWLTPGFELYIMFSPFVKMETVIQYSDRILSYVKNEENNLFILACEYI